MAVHYKYFFAAIAGHLIRCLLQKFQLQMAAVGDGTRLVLRFKDLSEIILGKNYGVFLLGGMQNRVADVEEIGSQRKMRPVFLNDSEREHATASRKRDAAEEIGCGQLLPVNRKFLLTQHWKREGEKKD